MHHTADAVAVRLRKFLSTENLQGFEFLGIEAWVARWCRANPELARRIGADPDLILPGQRLELGTD
jgi:hypothetical protein